jgi:Winged helix DNA-binding domain
MRVFQDERRRELFDLPDAPRPDADQNAPVRFLPEWDNLMLSHADRSRVIADAHRPAITTANLRLPGTFLVDGFVAGTWVATRKKASATLELRPFSPLNKSVQTSLEEEGESLLRFMEPDATSFAVTAAIQR